MTKTVLVVEDDPSVREALQGMLSLSDLNVVAVSRPEIACELAESIVPDLCIIDVMLPSASGIELAAELRDCGFGHTPLIAMSASPLMVEYAGESGLFQRVMNKPLDLDELVFTIDQLLDAAEDGDSDAPAGAPDTGR